MLLKAQRDVCWRLQPFVLEEGRGPPCTHPGPTTRHRGQTILYDRQGIIMTFLLFYNLFLPPWPKPGVILFVICIAIYEQLCKLATFFVSPCSHPGPTTRHRGQTIRYDRQGIIMTFYSFQ